MSEDYRIVSRARAEPRAEGCTGVRVRLELSGCPSQRWSRDFAARLSRELIGHAAVGHLRLNVNEIVQGNEIVLEGVEQHEAPALGEAVEQALDAANRASTGASNSSPNVAQKEADGIARTIELHYP